MEHNLDIVTIGECLIELSSNTRLSAAECLYKYYGGDALAAAVAALRLGSKVGFITRVGNDAFKEYLLDSWQAEGLDISQVKLSTDPNGFYFTAHESASEKEFAYYRRKIAPAKLSLEDISKDYITSARAIYASGITQSLSLSSKEAVNFAFQTAKENSVMTAYDPNFSSLITTPETAREYFNEIIGNVDVLFMSAKHDTVNILEISSVENIMKSMWDTGVSIVVIKSGQDGGYYTGYNGNIVFNEFYTRDVIDTTCAGDVFNGGFLHALVKGFTPFEAAKLASIVAGLQSQGIGAIKSIPYKDEVYNLFRGGANQS